MVFFGFVHDTKLEWVGDIALEGVEVSELDAGESLESFAPVFACIDVSGDLFFPKLEICVVCSGKHFVGIRLLVFHRVKEHVSLCTVVIEVGLEGFALSIDVNGVDVVATEERSLPQSDSGVVGQTDRRNSGDVDPFERGLALESDTNVTEPGFVDRELFEIEFNFEVSRPVHRVGRVSRLSAFGNRSGIKLSPGGSVGPARLGSGCSGKVLSGGRKLFEISSRWPGIGDREDALREISHGEFTLE